MNKEIFEVIFLSITVSGIATILSSLIGFFISLWIFFRKNNLSKYLLEFIRSLNSVPTVIFGLIVLLTLSRRGILGELNLLFTPTAIVIAQFLLLLPLIVTLCSEVLESDGNRIFRTCQILHIPKKKLKLVFFRELKLVFFRIFLIAFCRAISEVGSVMLVGGNIKGSTRVMTTYIALSTSMGNYNNSLKIGLVLFLISFCLNFLIKKVK